MSARDDVFYGGVGYGNTALPNVFFLWGTGSPEGVITGDKGAIFMDTATGNLYRKTTSGVNTGWVTP